MFTISSRRLRVQSMFALAFVLAMIIVRPAHAGDLCIGPAGKLIPCPRVNVPMPTPPIPPQPTAIPSEPEQLIGPSYDLTIFGIASPLPTFWGPNASQKGTIGTGTYTIADRRCFTPSKEIPYCEDEGLTPNWWLLKGDNPIQTGWVQFGDALEEPQAPPETAQPGGTAAPVGATAQPQATAIPTIIPVAQQGNTPSAEDCERWRKLLAKLKEDARANLAELEQIDTRLTMQKNHIKTLRKELFERAVEASELTDRISRLKTEIEILQAQFRSGAAKTSQELLTLLAQINTKKQELVKAEAELPGKKAAVNDKNMQLDAALYVEETLESDKRDKTAIMRYHLSEIQRYKGLLANCPGGK